MSQIKMDSSVAQDPIDIVNSELANAISPEELSALSTSSLAAKETPELVARLFAVAKKVASDAKAVIPNYSNFHTWDFFRKMTTEAQILESAAAMPLSMLPFGNCLTMASTTTSLFQEALRADSDSEIASYADQVECATDKWDQKATSARDYHCLTMLRLQTCCIDIDITQHSESGFTRLTRLSTPDNFLPYHFGVVYLAIGEARLFLTASKSSGLNVSGVLQSSASKSSTTVSFSDPFRSLKGGLQAGILNLVQPSVAYAGLPSRRTIHVSAHRTNPSQAISFWPFGTQASTNGWSNIFTLKINFKDRSLHIAGTAFNAWIRRPENDSLWSRVRDHVFFQSEGSRSWNCASFQVVLEPGVREQLSPEEGEHVVLLEELCSGMGMPFGEIMRIANVMLEVFREEAAKEAAIQLLEE